MYGINGTTDWYTDCKRYLHSSTALAFVDGLQRTCVFEYGSPAFGISFCIWSTELDSGLPSTNTYSCTRPNRAPDIELEGVDIELHNHRARHQLHGTSKRMTTSSSITYRAGWHSTSVRPDQFLYLVNRARLGFTEHEYLFVHETQPRSRYRARGGRHRAPQPSSSTLKSWYLEETNYIELHNIPSRMTFELSSYKGMHACRGGETDQYRARKS